MSYPENPDIVILKNKYYPNGLKEIDIWNYYQRVKRDLLKETFNRDLMFFIMTKLNNPVVVRKLKGSYIRLNPKNYDTVITGRSISIHSSMRNMEDFGVIDIDIHPNDGFRWAKKVTREVYSYVMDKIPIVSRATIRYTGKNSFHIICNFGRNQKVDVSRFLLEKFLRESELSRVYTVGRKRHPGVPNLDLGSNCVRCNFITLHSLSIYGLRCMEVPYDRIMSFDPVRARI